MPARREASISIHALLAESDTIFSRIHQGQQAISIHALLAESDASTQQGQREQRISIHALLAESDFAFWTAPNRPLRFLSTLSLRRATVHYDNYNLHCVISIHALLAESDWLELFLYYQDNNFYPRSPCGERLVREPAPSRDNEFLSTLSLRRATNARPEIRQHGAISIHALLAESDSTALA